MHNVDEYVDNLFTGLPVTKEALQMKQSMKEDLNTRYAYLVKEGKNENEALGIILKESTSMTPIRYELVIDEIMDQEKIEDIMISKRARYSRMAFGIVCCILSIPALIVMAEVLYEDILGLIAFFMFNAAGVYYIITSFAFTLTNKDYIVYEEEERKGKKKRSHFRFEDLVPLSVIFYLYVGAFHGGWHPWWIVIPASAIVFDILDKMFNLK